MYEMYKNHRTSYTSFGLKAKKKKSMNRMMLRTRWKAGNAPIQYFPGTT